MIGLLFNSCMEDSSMIGLLFIKLEYCLTLSWRRLLSYRNQSIDLIKQRNCFKNSGTSYSEYNKVTSVDFPSIYVALQLEL